jgi:hypothetical protein
LALFACLLRVERDLQKRLPERGAKYRLFNHAFRQFDDFRNGRFCNAYRLKK